MEDKICCRKKMKLIILYNFGDPNLGVREYVWQCEKCGKRIIK